MSIHLNHIPEELPYDFESGDLALDFANTAEWHASQQPEEHLHDYVDLVAWGAAAGLLPPAEVDALFAEARRRPDEAAGWYARAIGLREALFRIFSTVAEETPVDSTDLATLTAFWRELTQRTKLEVTPQGLNYQLETLPADPFGMLWPVVRSAVDLLTSPHVERIGQCQDDRGCGWLFIDTSRNRSRRWCSMESCGNRAKAQRHYGRVRGASNESERASY